MDCGFYLHLHVPMLITSDACAAARAAIRAAEIQAKAAKYAGRQSLYAGYLTVLGGGLAVGASIYAARIQTRLNEHKQRDYDIAFYRYLAALNNQIYRECIQLQEAMKSEGMSWISRLGEIFPENNITDKFLEEFGPANWEKLARTGDLLSAIEETHGALESLRSSLTYINSLVANPKTIWDTEKHMEVHVGVGWGLLSSLRSLDSLGETISETDAYRRHTKQTGRWLEKIFRTGAEEPNN